MAKVVFLESVAGVAGDMFTAAFVDAGLVTVEELNELARCLGLTDVDVMAETVMRATVKATRIEVTAKSDAWKSVFAGPAPHHHHHHGHRGEHSHHSDSTNLILGEDSRHHWHANPADIVRAIESSSMDDDTKELACEIFNLLATAEAEVHGVAVEEAAFHELGTVDSIMDVVMAAYCIRKIRPQSIFATPLKPGRGFVKIAHGTHPVPPPASARLLLGMEIANTPEAVARENVELSTPSGIAIVKALSPIFVAEMPAGKLLAQGSGSGTMDLGQFPNVFRIAVIESSSTEPDLPYERDSVVEIVCNIDDDTAEHIGWLCGQCMLKGALDVWQTPAYGKKGRVLVCLSVLAPQERFVELADWILRASTTFGIRYRTWNRLKLSRHLEERDVDGRTVRNKIGTTTDGRKVKEKPEFDDLMRAD